MAQTFSKPAGKNPFRKITRAAAAEVRVHKKIAIISFVLYGVATLLFLFNAQTSFDSRNSGFIYFSPSGWGAFFAVLGVAVGYFAALNVFRDMNNQQLCDVAMTLPIKSSERFFSKLLSLFYIQIAPLLFSTLIGNGIPVLIAMARCKCAADDRVITIVFGFLAASLFILAITVLSACCCGAFAESAYFSLIMMFIINALPIGFVFNIINNCSGFNVYWSEADIGYWGFLYLLFGAGEMLRNCVIGSVLSLAVLLLSGLIFKKRDGRTVGSPITSRVYFEIMMFLGCATIFSAFAMNYGAPWGVLIAAVAYLIINVIVSRAKINARAFLKWIGKYLATTAVFTGLLIAAVKTGGFGYISARPAAEYLERAKFSIDCYNAEKTIGLTTSALTAEQADQVMTICKKHIIKGRAEVDAVDTIDILFGNFSGRMTRVSISATGSKRFDFPPSPQSQFAWSSEYDKAKDIIVGQGYFLDYDQNIVISQSEALAMITELERLGFVQVKNLSR